jgi:hypothetical protein
MGVNPVVLGLAAVDRLHVEGVAEDEGDGFLGAEVGEPVPAEDALDADDEVVAVGLDGARETPGSERRLRWRTTSPVLWSKMQRYMVRAWRSMPQ